MLLPKGLTLPLLQTKWAAILNVLISNPSLQSTIIANVSLANGTTTINHGLQQKLVGWRIIGINGSASIYDQQSTNPHPELTLILVSNAAVTAQLEVF